MAGDWMKVEHNTPDKPEVFAIAAALDVDTDKAFAVCFRMWRWFDQHTEDGNAPSVSLSLLNSHLGVTGFCEACIDAGWLVSNNNGVSLPNFDRHNGQTAKARGLTYSRVRAHRDEMKRKCNAPSVTKALPETETETETENKKKEPLLSPTRKTFTKPTIEEIRAYCLERGNSVDPEAFHDHYEANGWMIGKSKMKRWQNAVHTWERTSKTNVKTKPEQVGRPLSNAEIDELNALGGLEPFYERHPELRG